MASKLHLSPEQKIVVQAIKEGKSVFIQGAAGTGKSEVVKLIKRTYGKKAVLLAPTGVAALNVGGYTIHHFFSLPVLKFYNGHSFTKLSSKKREFIDRMRMLVIDEVSMVSPDLLDHIDRALQFYRQSDEPFGGVQVVLIGDLFQLPPVITNDSMPYIKAKYGHANAYFFDANVFNDGVFHGYVFTKIYRQEDATFAQILTDLRTPEKVTTAIAYLNQHLQQSNADYSDAILLAPFRNTVKEHNEQMLQACSGELRVYEAIADITLKDADAPAPKTLGLKVGSLVMFTYNDELWCNGMLGTVIKLDDDEITVYIHATAQTVVVERHTWTYFTNDYDWDPEESDVPHTAIKTYAQFPLQLAYAFTIHKSQGKTLDRVIINLGKGVFAHGQLYVALTRARSIKDITLLAPLQEKDVIFDNRVRSLVERIEASPGLRIG